MLGNLLTIILCILKPNQLFHLKGILVLLYTIILLSQFIIIYFELFYFQIKIISKPKYLYVY